MIGPDTLVYHASDKKRNGRLWPNYGEEFGTAVYFGTDRKLVEYHYGTENTTIARLKLINPVYTDGDKWNVVVKRALKNYNKVWSDKNKSRNVFTEDQEEEYKNNGYVERYSDYYDLPSADYISNAAKELGHDAIVFPGSPYGDEIAVLNESAIIYVEDEMKKPGVKMNIKKDNKSQQLWDMIADELSKCCETRLPRLRDFLKTPEGLETAQNAIYQMCATQGISIQTAMSLYDSEL